MSNMNDLYVSKITKAGQVSIPKELREEMGLKEAAYVAMEPKKGIIIMRKVRSLEDELSHFEKEAKSRGIAKKDVQKAIDEVRPGLVKELYGI